MKKILILAIFTLLQSAFAEAGDKCPRFIKVQKITVPRYNPDDWNPRPIGDTGVIKTQRLFAEFLEGTVGYKLKLNSKNQDSCQYNVNGKNDAYFSKILFNFDSKNNNFSYLVTLKLPSQDGWNAFIQEVKLTGNYELKNNVITVLENSTGYTFYSGTQWWGTEYAIFHGVSEGKFELHQGFIF